MTIKPLADRVLVKPAPAEEKTVGGIIIPDTAQEKPSRGAVVAVGQGTKDETMVLKAGDNVLYGKYAGTEVEIDGEKLLIMRQSDVLAVVEKNHPSRLASPSKRFLNSFPRGTVCASPPADTPTPILISNISWQKILSTT